MSDGVRRYGVEYDVRTDRSYPYYEVEMDYSPTSEDGLNDMKTGQEATTRMDQQPTDRGSAKIRVYDRSGFLTNEQAKAPIARPIKLSLGQRIPPILKSVTATFSKSSGSGTSDHLAANMAIQIVTVGSGTLDPKSSAQASASIVGGVTWDIETWQQDAVVNGTTYEFTDAPGLTIAQIIARLAAQVTAEDLPIYKKKSLQVVLKSQQVSLQQSADSQVSLSANLTAATSSFSTSKGDSQSVETGVTLRVETIPPCLFNTLSIISNTDSSSVSVTVKANIPATPASPASPITPAVTNEPTTLTGNADASVNFFNGTNTVGPTVPPALDTTKNYIVDIDTREDELGTGKYLITVVNFGQYA